MVIFTDTLCTDLRVVNTSISSHYLIDRKMKYENNKDYYIFSLQTGSSSLFVSLYSFRKVDNTFTVHR
jgi:hypothetical protein